MKFEIPKSMKTEHDELHADLVKATNAGGKTGEAAKAVAKVLHNHFIKEEEYALPPLGLLVALSEGRFEPGMAEVLKMTRSLFGNCALDAHARCGPALLRRPARR